MQVNISVGTTYRTRNDKDVLVRGVEQLWDQGLVVVAAAGNQGPEPGSITAPGCSKKVITVGSSDMLMGKEESPGEGRRLSVSVNRIWWHRDAGSCRVRPGREIRME